MEKDRLNNDALNWSRRFSYIDTLDGYAPTNEVVDAQSMEKEQRAKPKHVNLPTVNVLV